MQQFFVFQNHFSFSGPIEISYDYDITGSKDSYAIRSGLSKLAKYTVV